MSDENFSITINEFGGPEVLQGAYRDPGPLDADEILIRHQAIGVNFTDVYRRSGLYPAPLPANLGMEAAGVVEAAGSNVSNFAPGDRVAYVTSKPGAYSRVRVMPAAQVCKLPDQISFEDAAAMMLKGLTVQYLFRRTTPLKPGDTVLFHAAAGGVGLIACQWARAEGITLIGTAGTDAKCALATEYGAAHMINYQTEDFAACVREITDGKGVDVVMDSIGKDIFNASLNCLKPLGMMISFGNATGPVGAVDLANLAAKGSLKLTRPSLFTHISALDDYHQMVADLFAMVASGDIKICIGQRFALDDAADAHRALEARQTTGGTILIP